jgi:hypothetical protein
MELNTKVMIPKSEIRDIIAIMTKIESKLNALEIKTNSENNIISFKMINFILIDGNQSARYKGLRIFKEGKISLYTRDDFFEVIWTIKLDSLYFLAFFSSIVLSFMTKLFFDVDTFILIWIGLSFFALSIVSGLVSIKLKIKRIIDTSIYNRIK